MARSQDRKERIRRAAKILREDSSWMTQSELARRLGVSRDRVWRDLPRFDDEEVLLMEDERGRLRLMKS